MFMEELASILQKVSVKRIKPSIKGSRKSRISIFSNKKTQRKRK
jgi:hypothetical protein